MTVFLWVMVLALGMTCASKLFLLAVGNLPPRTPAGEALDVAINGALLAWAVVLLAGA